MIDNEYINFLTKNKFPFTSKNNILLHLMKKIKKYNQIDFSYFNKET